MNELIGETIKEIRISDDKQSVIFINTDEYDFCYYTVNDCCNDVWINHLNGLDYLIGEKITGVIHRDWQDMTTEEAISDGHKYPDVEEKLLDIHRVIFAPLYHILNESILNGFLCFPV